MRREFFVAPVRPFKQITGIAYVDVLKACHELLNGWRLPVVLEGELPEGFQKRVMARYGLPGRCGLLKSPPHRKG
jgi:hypothetical protein